MGLQCVLKSRLYFQLRGVGQVVFGYLRVLNAFLLEKESCFRVVLYNFVENVIGTLMGPPLGLRTRTN